MKSYWLWLLLVPTLFLPNFGDLKTPMGVLETGDFMALPVLIFLILDPTRNRKFIFADFILRPGLAFVFWAILGVILIYFFYPYHNPNKVVTFSMLKIGKFALYAAIPIIISRKLHFESIRREYDWMILASCLIVGTVMLLSPGRPSLNNKVSADFYYKAANLISNVLAVFVTYLSGLLIVGYGSRRWRQAVKWSLVVIVIGLSYTKGRGGWLAALAGFTYLSYVRGFLRARVLTGIGVCFLALTGLFFFNQQFRSQVSSLIISKSEYSGMADVQLSDNTTDYVIGSATDLAISDSERIATWTHEIVKFANAPFFGTGFHHRGGLSGLWPNGSHNFWMQMFLETGLIGGILIILIFIRMWRHADSKDAKELGISIPLKTSLVTAFIGGLGGEYFTGGMGLLAILLCYAPVGALSAIRPIDRVKGQQGNG